MHRLVLRLWLQLQMVLRLWLQLRLFWLQQTCLLSLQSSPTCRAGGGVSLSGQPPVAGGVGRLWLAKL